jgi:hypothetical protein
MTDPRAVRYRRLALAENDPEKARILRLLADEAEQGILCVPEQRVKNPATQATPLPEAPRR